MVLIDRRSIKKLFKKMISFEGKCDIGPFDGVVELFSKSVAFVKLFCKDNIVEMWVWNSKSG